MAVAMNKYKYSYFYIPPESPIRFHSGGKKRCVPLPPWRLHFIHPHFIHPHSTHHIRFLDKCTSQSIIRAVFKGGRGHTPPLTFLIFFFSPLHISPAYFPSVCTRLKLRALKITKFFQGSRPPDSPRWRASHAQSFRPPSLFHTPNWPPLGQNFCIQPWLCVTRPSRDLSIVGVATPDYLYRSLVVGGVSLTSAPSGVHIGGVSME